MAMANAGFDGTVTEADYAYMWAVGGQDGVESAAAWKVTQGTGRQISCAAQSGRAFAKGVVSKDTAANLVSLSTPTNGGWYLICRHIDWTANTVTVIALTGPTTTTTAPTAPPADYSGVTGMSAAPGATYDHPLAWAWVRSSDTTMVLFDLRRVPGSAADLAELATLGGIEGETKIVREGGAQFERTAGSWVQRTPATFASSSARDTAYAKASAAYRVQGALVFRSDTGWTEQYFGTYNSSTNTGGAKTAGWFPVTGPLPGGSQVRSAAAQSLTGVNYTLLPASFFSETLTGAQKPNGMSTTFATNGGWVAPFEGIFDVSAYVTTVTTSGAFLLLKKNSATSDSVGAVAYGATVASVGGLAVTIVQARLALASGDILRLALFLNGSGTVNATPEIAAFGIRFVEPVRG